MTQRSTIFATLLLFLVLLAGSNQLYAQCDRFGKVTAIEAGCGAIITEAGSGEIFQVLPNSYSDGLVVGAYLHFGAESAAPNPNCITSVPATPIYLTCRQDTSSCAADFEYIRVSTTARTLFFSAIVDGANQQICSWDFGDGTPVTISKQIAHTFLAAGDYAVCLTVKDAAGCTVQICKTVTVSSENIPACGYSVYMTAVGKKIFGKLAPNTTTHTIDPLAAVQWRDLTHNQILEGNLALGVVLPEFGAYYISVTYTTQDSAGNVNCSSTACQLVNVVENVCTTEFTADSTLNCGTINAPVCGCDGVLYANECEAMAAGVLSWKAGPCSSNSSFSAGLDVTNIDGSPDLGYTVQFHNTALGNYTALQLDFGDGTPFENSIQWNETVHTYAYGGIYRVNLTVWNSSGVSSVTKLLATDSYNLTSDNLPDATDYVLPGDANGDKKANVYDLLNVGLGYGTNGVPRPNATTNWAEQFAPNWSQSVITGVNYKHLDCNGDGKINEFDADNIEPHYAAIDTLPVLPVPGLPQVRVQFAQDTFVVSENASSLEFNADVLIGSYTQPALDLYGIAFALRYPEFIEHNPEADYDDNSFFGFSNHILWLPKDIYDRRQFDMGFVRKNGAGASGYGRIATLTLRTDFIIIVDIVDRTSTRVIPFTIPVTGLQGIDPSGNPVALSVPVEMDTLWIELPELSGIHEPTPLEQVAIAPNPSTQTAILYTGNLDVQRIEAVNALGQTVHTMASSGLRTTHIEVADWKNGFYTLRIYTNQGVVTKKLVVQH